MARPRIGPGAALSLVMLLLGCCLQGCGAGAPAQTATPSPGATAVALAQTVTPSPGATAAATPTMALPADCTLLLRYESGNRYSSPCIYAICEDGRVLREGGTCPAGVAPPERLSKDQLAQLEEQISASDFFALEGYYPSPDGC